MGFDQQGGKRLPPPRVAAGGERAERIAVIALPPRDHMAALRLTGLDKKLPGEFQRRLDRLRAAADEIDFREPRRRIGDQPFGQRLGRLGGEKGCVRIGEPVELRV